MVTRQEYLNNRLAMYMEAEAKILESQSYTISNRTLTRADLDKVRKAIDDLLDQGAQIDGADCRTKRVKKLIFQ